MFEYLNGKLFKCLRYASSKDEHWAAAPAFMALTLSVRLSLGHHGRRYDVADARLGEA